MADDLKSWDEVSSSEAYKKLSASEKEAARAQYFDQVVAPRVSATDLPAARSQFDLMSRGRRSPATAAESAPDPTEGMSATELALAGMGSTFHRIWQGTGKLARDVAELVPGGEKVANAAGLPTNEDIEETRRLEAPARRPEEVLPPIESGKLGIHQNALRGARESPSAFTAGDVAGNVALSLPLAFAPGANTVLGSSLYGAGYGALQPAADWSERGRNALLTGATSGGVTGAVRAAPAAYRSFVAPFTEKGRDRLAVEAIERFAKDSNAVRNSLSGSAPAGAPSVGELIPGSRASLAEVTEDPGIAQLQRSVAAASPDAANEIAAGRTTRLNARKDALLSQFGVSSKQSLEAARDAAAARMYREAWDTPIEPKTAKANSGAVKELLARPSIQTAQKEALDLAKEEGEVLSERDLKGGSVKGLHYVKRALDGQIERAKASGDSNLARVITGTQKKLLGLIDDLSPAYKKARESFAEASRPINQAEVGSYLYDKLFPALSDLGAERMTPGKYASVLKEGDEMAKKATGFPGAKLKDILTTDQWNTVVNLGKDLGREVGATERGRVPGSPTAQYLAGRNVLRQVLGPVGLPESWSEKMAADVLGNRWMSLAAEPVERDVQNRLAMMLADPRKAVAARNSLDRSAAGAIPRGANWLMRNALPPAALSAGALSNMEGRQDGGPVDAGVPYVVGEAGPEIVVPQQPATVLPNANSGMSGVRGAAEGIMNWLIPSAYAGTDAMDPRAMAAYKEATGGSIDARPQASGAVPERTSQGVVAIPPNIAGLAKLLLSTGRAANADQAMRMAMSMQGGR